MNYFKNHAVKIFSAIFGLTSQLNFSTSVKWFLYGLKMAENKEWEVVKYLKTLSTLKKQKN